MAKGLQFHDGPESSKSNSQNPNNEAGSTSTWNKDNDTWDLTGSSPKLNQLKNKVSRKGKKSNPSHFKLNKLILSEDDAGFPSIYKKGIEDVIHINVKNGQLVENNLWGQLTKRSKRYWVSYQNIDEVKGMKFSVMDVQSGQTLLLWVDCQLEVIKDKGFEAVTFFRLAKTPTDSLVNYLDQWIKAFCSRQNRLVDNFFQLEDQLKEFISNSARTHGLSIRLYLRPELEETTIQNYSLIDHVVFCRIKNYEVEVKLNLALNLTDERKFRKTNIDNVDTYIRERADQIVQNELLSLSYAQLVREFNPSGIEGRIKYAIDRFTASIGFSVTQLVAIPQLDIFQWLEQFQFVTDQDEKGETKEDQEFATKDSRINVRLSIAVSGRISSFHGGTLEKYLRPNVNLEEVMKAEVIKECRRFLHEIEPHDFYFHFSSPSAEGVTFESSLEERIRIILAKEYNARDLSIIIKPVDTGITLRFKELQKRSHQVHVKNFLGDIDFDLWFKVVAVHQAHWSLFQSNDYSTAGEEITAIRRKIKNYVENQFNNNLAADFYQTKGQTFINDILELINGPKIFNCESMDLNRWLSNQEKPPCARSEIIKEFGLLIIATDIKRNATEAEHQLIGDRQADIEINKIKRHQRIEQAKLLLDGEQADLKNLYRQKQEAMDAGLDEEVEEINEKIEAIRSAVMKGTNKSSRLKFLENSESNNQGLKWISSSNQEESTSPDQD